MRSRRLARALLVPLAWACSGGAGEKGPTTPAQTQVNLTALLAFVALPVTEADVIIEVHLLFDGQVVDRQTHSPPIGAVGFGFRDVQIPPGNHTIAIRVVRQTVTSQRYDFSGQLTVHKPGAQKSFSIPSIERQLRAGESAEFRFDATL